MMLSCNATSKPCSRTPHGVRGLKLVGDGDGGIIAGRTPHGVRGLKSETTRCTFSADCRTPHGVRGLKYGGMKHAAMPLASHPSRGAWIEMTVKGQFNGIYGSHPSRGAWIEIWASPVRRSTCGGRTPHGVRGLKCCRIRRPRIRRWSHPSRGAWIEIPWWIYPTCP